MPNIQEGSSMNNERKMDLITLPHDLIIEILLRLPVRSLLRFKCVCKSWRSLISDPEFAESHFGLNSAPTHRLLLRFSNEDQVESIDLESSLHDRSTVVTLNLPPASMSGNDNPLHFLGSCRGFMLLLYEQTHDVIVWNPSTRVHQPILDIESDHLMYKFLYGFGYDKSTDDYLVVFVSLSDTETEIYVLSLITDSWYETMGSNFTYSDLEDDFSKGMLLNEALHWLVTSNATNLHVVIGFDLVERSLLDIPLSVDLVVELTGEVYNLTVLGGCLSLCYSSGRKEIAEIWVMTEYRVQSSWTKSFVLSVSEIPCKGFFPLFFTEGSGVLGSNGNGRLMKFNEKGILLEQHQYGRDYEDAVKYFEMYQESLLLFPRVQSLHSNFEEEVEREEETEDDQHHSKFEEAVEHEEATEDDN